MKHHGRGLVEVAVLLLFAGLLFYFPNQSAQAARGGITLCLDLLIPSLFPFFVLSSLFISTGLAGVLSRPLTRLMGPLFGVSGAGASALLLGAVGGYPVGARTLAQLTTQRTCTKREAQRLSLFCNNCGPAFFIGAAGVGVFGSKEAGFLMLCANFTGAILIGLALRLALGRADEPGTARSNVPRRSLASQFPDCIHSAFSASLNVCAYVIFFSVITTLADCSGLLPACVDMLSSLLPGSHAPALCRSLLIGLVELSTGTTALSEALSSPAALPLAAFILGWGGLSVHCQSLPFWQEAGIRPGPYLAAKLLQGILSAGLTALGMVLFPLSLPVMAPVPVLTVPSLLGREMAALWALAGISFLFSGRKREKRCGNDTRKRYNKK